MSETFCQTHGVHVLKWEWKQSIATWIHQKITPKTNSTSKHITTEQIINYLSWQDWRKKILKMINFNNKKRKEKSTLDTVKLGIAEKKFCFEL